MGASVYTGHDQHAYAEAKYGVQLAPSINAALSAQIADQRSTGTEMLNGGAAFWTNQFGIQGQLGYDTAILTAAFTSVNPSFGMQTPWSANPFYTDGLINPYNKAGENTFLVGACLRPLGLPGVAASVFYYNGQTTAPAAGMPLSEYEWDFNLEWRPEWKPLQGLWFRARYGYFSSSQSNIVTTVDEVPYELRVQALLSEPASSHCIAAARSAAPNTRISGWAKCSAMRGMMRRNELSVTAATRRILR